jgi:hypothetical protein
VTEAGGTHHGLANVNVQVHAVSSDSIRAGLTAADGTYTAVGLPAGTDYQVCFDGFFSSGGASDSLGYLGQCHNDQPRRGTPTPVTIIAGATTTGTDAALAIAGAISGEVADAGGAHHGLAHVSVSVESASNPAGISVRTADDGSYNVAGLATGTDYRVCFWANGATGGSSDTKGYLDQCYNARPSSSPTPVSVTEGTNTFGTNAVLVGTP